MDEKKPNLIFFWLALIISIAIASFEAGIIYETKRPISDEATKELVLKMNTKVEILWVDLKDRNLKAGKK